MSETSLLPWEKRIDGGLNTDVDKMLEDLEGDTQQRDGSINFGSLGGLFGLRTVTISALLQILGILRLHKQEDRNSHNQDSISELTWSINSGQMKSGPAAFTGFRCWRADVSSSTVKSLKRLTVWC